MQLSRVVGFLLVQKIFMAVLRVAVVCMVLQPTVYAMQDTDFYDTDSTSGAPSDDGDSAADENDTSVPSHDGAGPADGAAKPAALPELQNLMALLNDSAGQVGGVGPAAQLPFINMQNLIALLSGGAVPSPADDGAGPSAQQSPAKLSEEQKKNLQEVLEKIPEYERLGQEALKRCKEGVLKQLQDPVEREKLLNAESYRKKEQLKFNRKELWRIPAHADKDEFKIIIQNQDIFKSGLAVVELGLEWQLYQKIQAVFAHLICEGIIKQRAAFLTTLEAFGASLENKNERVVAQVYKTMRNVCNKVHEIPFKELMSSELVPAFAQYVFFAQIIESLKRHYLWDDDLWYEGGKVFLADLIAGYHKGNTNCVEASFDFFKKQINLNTPFSLWLNSVQNMFSALLYRFDILPSWTNSLSFLGTRQMAFVILFAYWSSKSFFFPLLVNRVFLAREELIKLLKTYEEQKTQAEKKKQEALIYEFVEHEYEQVFPSWFIAKNKKYALWRTCLSVAVMLPSIASGMYKIGSIMKPLFTGASAAQQNADGV